MDDHMEEILVQMESVLNIANIGQYLPESLRAHVGNLSGENHPILQAPIEIPNLTAEQCNEATVVVLEEIWNHAC